MASQISVVDLYCGVGGLTYGLGQAGLTVAAGVDKDPSCRFPYEANNAAEFVEMDLGRASGDQIAPLFSDDSGPRVLVGCPPCQPFSTHTQKYEDRHDRPDWGLLTQFGVVVEQIRPEVVSVENVVRIRRETVFSDFLSALQRLGYHATAKVVRCADYGVPQTRRRLVLLASRLGPIELVPPTHSPQDYVTVHQAIGDLPVVGAGTTSTADPLHRTSALSARNLKRIRHSKPGGSWRDWPKHLRAKCHTKKSGSTYSSVYSRMSWHEPGPTVTTQFYRFGTGRFGHPEQDRAITVREGMRLQTFPDSYELLGDDDFSFLRLGTQIGNALPIRVGTAIGQSILAHIEDR